MNKKIVIGGCGRSGTTILLEMLRQDPTIAGYMETRLLSSIGGNVFDLCDGTMTFEDFSDFSNKLWYDERLLSGDAGGHGPGANFRDVLTFEEYIGRFEAAYLKMRDIGDIGERYRLLCETVNGIFQHVAEQRGKRWWCEKAPSNILSFDKILIGMPDVKFIYTYRHPYDIFTSLKSYGWWGDTVSDIYKTFIKYIDKGFKCMENASEENFYAIMMEDFVQSEIAMKYLYEWMGLTYCPGVFHNIDHSLHHIGRWTCQIKGKWTIGLSQKEIKTLEKLGVDKIAKRMGYSVDDSVRVTEMRFGKESR